MSFETWQVIPAPLEGELGPILSTLSGRCLEQKVVAELGLSDDDSLFGALHSSVRDFSVGRLVIVNSLQPNAVLARGVEVRENGPTERWLRSAGFIIELSEQQSQGCYGGWHKGFALRVFGPPLGRPRLSLVR
jgi:hypothetical protein